MTQIPLHFLALFADLHVGDELILHKGAGASNWKIDVLERLPRGDRLPLPPDVWQSVLSPLPDAWYGSLRFYCGEQAGCGQSSWLVIVKSCPPVDLNQGMIAVTTRA